MIAFGIYKRNQAVRSRTVGLITAAALGLFLGRWLHAELIDYSAGVSYGVPFAAGFVLFAVGAFFMNWPPLVELLVETEAELAKVAWSSRKDLWKSTWVVIFTIAFMATFMFLVTKILIPVFVKTGVLLPERQEGRPSAAAPAMPGQHAPVARMPATDRPADSPSETT